MTVPTNPTAKILRQRFGLWLKQAREDADLTQVQLSTALQYAYPTPVSAAELGKSAIPLIDLARWAEAIKVPPKTLAKRWLYYMQPEVHEALYGIDPYLEEKLPRPERVRKELGRP